MLHDYQDSHLLFSCRESICGSREYEASHEDEAVALQLPFHAVTIHRLCHYELHLPNHLHQRLRRVHNRYAKDRYASVDHFRGHCQRKYSLLLSWLISTPETDLNSGLPDRPLHHSRPKPLLLQAQRKPYAPPHGQALAHRLPCYPHHLRHQPDHTHGIKG